MQDISSIIKDHYILFSILFGIYGAVIASFLNVVFYRLPLIIKRQEINMIAEWLRTKFEGDVDHPGMKCADQMEIKEEMTLSFPSSHCPHCKTPIRWYHNVPVLGWLILRGRCHACNEPISPIYPVIELVGGVIGVLSYLIPVQMLQQSVWQPVIWLTLISFFSTIFVVDWKTMRIPQILFTIPWFIGLITSLLGISPLGVNANQALLGSMFGFSLLAVPAFIFKAWKGYEGLGDADPWLLAAIGSLIGLQVIAAFLLSFIAFFSFWALLYKKTKDPQPFGPSLIIGAMLAIAFQPIFMI